MRTPVLLLLSCVCGAAQQISIMPPIKVGLTELVMVRAEQLPGHRVSVQISNDLATWREGALYKCNQSDQWVLAAFPVRPDVKNAFYRSINTPCAP